MWRKGRIRFETGLASNLESMDSGLPGPAYSGELALGRRQGDGRQFLGLSRDASSARPDAPRRGRERGRSGDRRVEFLVDALSGAVAVLPLPPVAPSSIVAVPQCSAASTMRLRISSAVKELSG